MYKILWLERTTRVQRILICESYTCKRLSLLIAKFLTLGQMRRFPSAAGMAEINQHKRFLAGWHVLSAGVSAVR